MDLNVNNLVSLEWSCRPNKYLFSVVLFQKNTKGGSAVNVYPNFNPSADAAALDKAITAKGMKDISCKKN